MGCTCGAPALKGASHGASSPHPDERCQEIQRAPEDARVVLERRRERQIRAVRDIAEAGRNARVEGTRSYNAGWLALVKSMRYVTWPNKFRPKLPPR